MVANRKYVDRRVADRYLEKGLLKESDFKNHLQNLPDEEPNAQWVQMDLHDAEISEEDKGLHCETGLDSDDDELESAEEA